MQYFSLNYSCSSLLPADGLNQVELMPKTNSSPPVAEPEAIRGRGGKPGAGRIPAGGLSLPWLLVFFAVSTMLFTGPAGSACHAATGSNEVIVGAMGDFKPYSFVDEKGQPAGFGVDLITAVARTMDIPIRISPGTWDTGWHGLVAGKLDVLPVVAKLPSRVPLVDFGLPHTETFDAFIVRKGEPLLKDIAGAADKEIIVMRSDAAHHALLEHGFVGKVIPVETISEMLSLLSSGRHDAILYPKLLGTMEIRERRIRGLSVGPPIPDYKRAFSFAVKNGDHELLEKLNQGLLIVKSSGEYDRIYEKWLSIDEPWHKLKKYVVPAVTIALVVIFGAGVWLLMLHVLVGKRTKEIVEAKKSLREINATLAQRIAERTAELQTANASLRENEQQLRLVLDASAMGSFAFDILTGEVRWNDTEFALLGLEPGAAQPGAETFFRCVHPEDAGILREKWAAALRGGMLEAEFRIVRPDGEVRWLAGKGRFVSGDEIGADPPEKSGQARRFLGVNYDITQHKLTEAALRESELFYRQTLDSIPGMVFTTRPDGYCDYQSQPWVDFTGVPMHEHLGDGWNKLLHPEDRPRAYGAWQAAVEGRAPYDLEYRVRRHDGAYEWFKVRGRPIRNAAGEIVRWFGTALNIDQLLKAQEALRESTEFYRVMGETLPYGVWMCGPDGEAQYASRSFLDLLEMSMEEMKQFGWTRRLPAEDVAPMLKKWRRCVNKGEPWDHVHRVYGPEQKLHYVLSRGLPVRDKDGKITTWVGINLDIDERKQAEEKVLKLSGQITARNVELEYANRELESFIYSISHDLRGPLRSIASFISFLGMDYSDRFDARGKDYLARISNGSAKMNRLIEDMLHLSQVSRQEVSREVVDISSLVNSVISDLRAADPERRVEVVVKAELSSLPAQTKLIPSGCKEEVAASADPGLLEMVFANLLGNAWKFTGKTENARIESGTKKQNGLTVYYIKDNGAGFAQEYAGRMFMPFHRLHSEDEFEGTGIGLAIVERIIQRHGGKVWAEGEPGKGATVFFTLGA